MTTSAPHYESRLLAGLGLLLAWMPVQVAGADDEDDEVIVSERISLDYDGDPEALARALDTATERTVEVDRNDSVHAILAREFGVGPTRTPDAYSTFESDFLERNGVSSPDELKYGTTVRVPDLPPIARETEDEPTEKLLPKVVVDGQLGRLLHGPRRDRISVTALGRAGAQEAVVYRKITKASATEAMKNGSRLEVQSADLEIRFEPGGGSTGGAAISAAEAVLVRGKLAGTPQQKPVLIVLDDSWPDDASFVAARDFLWGAISTIRKHYKITDKGFSSSLGSATAAPWKRPPPPGRQHSQWIQAALEPLQALEPSMASRVRVVYLPLFTLQAGAEELFEHLIALNQVIAFRHNNFEDPVPSDVVRTARAIAAQAVARIARASHRDLKKTDVALIQAMFAFCEYYGEAARQPCYLNMSWTTPKMWFNPIVPAAHHGVFVAAAGNDGESTNLYSLQRQFAVRSGSPGDMLAVMNIDEHGAPTCRSTTLGSDLQDLFAVAFSGQLDGNCGTSFAAPRVAWLLAAREAMLPRTGDAIAWRRNIRREIVNGANASAVQFNRVRLNVRALFERIP